MTLSIVSFGVVYRVKDPVSIVIAFNVLRFVQGAASAMVNTSCYAFASVAYPDDVEKIISLFEGVVGLGNMAGPVLGSVVYNWLGF